MRRFVLLAFIGVLLMEHATLSEIQGYSSGLTWLFGLNSKINKNKEEHKEGNEEKNKPTVCQTKECKKIARIISESMDKSVDPCEDFYEYACGKWPEHNLVPEGMDSWSMIFSAQQNVLEQIKAIFDEGPKDDDLLAVKLAKKWYAVCMDTDSMEKQGLEPLVFTLSRIGGWPMIMEPDEWNEEEYSWQKVDDQYVRLTGRNAFHDVRVMGIYSANESRKAVDIKTPYLPPDSYKLVNNVEEDKSDEDPSDEKNQSGEQTDSEEPGSEGEDHDESDNNSNGDNDDNNDDDDDNDDDNNNNEDNDDNENDDKSDDNNGDTNEQDDNENAKKKVGMKNTGKFAKNKKVGHNRKMKRSIHSKKYKIYEMVEKRVKKRTMPTNVHEKLHARKNKRNHMKQARRERLKKTLKSTTPLISTEETCNENNNIKKYANYISKVARAIAKARGVEVSEKNMNKDIQEMIEFQTKLFHIITTNHSEDKEEMTLNGFQEWYDKWEPKTANSEINWLYKIGELFNEAQVLVDGDLDLNIVSPNYFEDLVGLLDETSSRTIVNYIHWNFLSSIIRTTTSEMKELYYAWEGTQKNDDARIFTILVRQFKCVTEIDMGTILAYEYVKNHFSDEIKTSASDMMDDIQKEVEYQIKESDWMDEDTKDFVLAKLVNIKNSIGPDWYKNNTVVKRYFQGLIIGNSYYENTLSYDRCSKWKRLREVRKDENYGIPPVLSMMVNAFFSSRSNTIMFPAADFQSPLFAYDRPQVINYGIIGTIMAHEVNHGFDDRGYKFNKKGDIVEWSPEMAEAYSKRAECFVEQFNNYPITKKSNYKIENYGNYTIGDNIADSMGLNAAFRAYRRRERECEKIDAVLPGLEGFTNDKLFFLSFANFLCEVETNRTMADAKYDMHSTARLRVIGSVSNSQDFAKAYNCPVGSAMNPEKKCYLWK